jgi:recombination protein RecR
LDNVKKYPEPIANLVASLTRLPGVGPKTALRYAYALLYSSKSERQKFAEALLNLRNVRSCPICFTHTEDDICEICRDEKRETHIVCMVSQAKDISTIEVTGSYKGRYFVLGGTLNPIEGDTPETLRVREFLQYLKDRPAVKEVILAFSPDVRGETTIMYFSRKLRENELKVTRLARGLPMGADIEYADEVTLTDALLGRRET